MIENCLSKLSFVWTFYLFTSTSISYSFLHTSCMSRHANQLDPFFVPATVLCLPLLDEMTSRVLIELNVAWQTHIQNSVILMVHTEDIDLFLPRDDSSLSTDPTTLVHSAITQSSNFSTSNVTRAGPYATPERDERMQRVQHTARRFAPPRNLSSTTIENLLVVTPLDQR